MLGYICRGYGIISWFICQSHFVAWKKKYPPSRWPVIAFTGAPAPFPVRSTNLHLHEHLFNWNEEINELANNFIDRNLPKGPFVGIHLRNGVDFVSYLYVKYVRQQ